MESPSIHLEVAICVSGELDLLTAPQVRAELLALVWATHAPQIVVDLGGVTFADTTGMQPFEEAQLLLHRAGRNLQLRNVPPPVTRLIHAAGLGDTFDVVGGGHPSGHG